MGISLIVGAPLFVAHRSCPNRSHRMIQGGRPHRVAGCCFSPLSNQGAAMSRTTWAFLALAAVGGIWASRAGADEAREVKIVARGPWPHLPTHASAGIGTAREHHLWVLRS